MRALVAGTVLALAGCGDSSSGPAPDPGLVGRIAFSRADTSGHSIWVMNADGSAQTRLTHGPSDETPSFSPDGTQIAFSHYDSIAGTDIVVMNADGTGWRDVTAGLTDTEVYPRWSRDGSRLAFNTLNYWPPVQTISVSGLDRRLIGAGGLPEWTLDGAHLLITGLADSTDAYSGIVSVSLDSLQRTRVSPPDASDLEAAVSPDGTHIAYVQLSSSGNPSTNRAAYGIGVMRADGTDRRLVVGDTVSLYRTPTWSPDGTHIAFMSTRSGTEQIWVVRADGTGLRQLTYKSAHASQVDDGDSGPTWTTK